MLFFFILTISLYSSFDFSLIIIIFLFDVTESGNFESSLCEQYVHQKLESGLKRLWHDAQTRVSALFMSAELTHFKFDEFLQLLAIVHRYLCCAQFIIVTIDLASHISNHNYYKTVERQPCVLAPQDYPVICYQPIVGTVSPCG